MSRDSRDLTVLLSMEKGVKALISYVNKTECLHLGKGEYTIS